MRHRDKRGRKFGRIKKVRKALLKSLSSALILNGRIRTTKSKARELARKIAPLITKAKHGGLANIRALRRVLPPAAVKKLVGEIGPKYQSRPGGYTRVVNVGRRAGDGAPMAIIELI